MSGAGKLSRCKNQAETRMREKITGAVFVYRGVNREMHDAGIGLQPRNGERPFRREVWCDGTWRLDGSVIFGDPVSQAVHAHQLDSEAFGGPGLSFTTDEAVARGFATTGGLQSGVVYVACVEQLIAIGCALFDPRQHTAELENPNEREVIVVPPTGVSLTLAHMARLIEVR